jgi:peptidoglycan pentaglycine glycine transferase (the first glycine)
VSNSWNELIAALPNPHFLQTYEWGQVKARYGWEPIYLIWDSEGKMREEKEKNLSSLIFPARAAALILKKKIVSGGLAARLCILYAPKGPLLDWGDEALRTRVLDDLQRFARQQGAIFLKLDPDVALGTGIPGTETDRAEPGGEAVRADLVRRGWRFSEDQIQFKNTVILDVSASEEEMLARMKQKTRYNVRLGPKKDVAVRVGNESDWPMLYKMYAETSVRDGFVIRDEAYYRRVWALFDNSTLDTRTTNIEYPISNIPLAEPLIAEVDGEPVAAVFLFAFGGRAYYVYGMSREAHREKMPTYLLQWEAMKWARARGCSSYDLWGAPDVFNESDSMWGVFRFKEGLGGQVLRTLGAWDYAPNPLWYAMYTKLVPMLLDVMRSRGKARTRQGLGG